MTSTTTIPATMRAVRLQAEGGPEQLVSEEIATPAPKAGEALVRVHAAAITRDELEWPVDRLPAIPSYELSGVVAALGDGADDLAIGDEVYALTPFDRDGVAAEYALVRGERLAPKPRALNHVEAAAVPLPALTAWQGLFDHGRLAAGERVLIHGATGGVGQFATRLAKRHGAHVIATVSTRAVEQARELGADEVVDHTATSFEEAIAPVDLVFDTAGGDRLARSSSVLRPSGRLVSVAEEAAGAVYFVVEPSRKQLREITALVEGGALKPTIDSVYSPTTPEPRSSARGRATRAARSSCAHPDLDPWEPRPMAVIERLDFLGVPTQDPERSRSFYRGVLGLRPDEHAEWEQWAGDTCFVIWEPEKQGRPFVAQKGSPWPLRCDDVAEMRAVLEAKGVQFFGDTLDTGVCQMAFFADPDGNELMLHRRYAPYE